MSYDVPPEAVDLMALNRLDHTWKGRATIWGLRSAVDDVIDTAARHQGISRADAHARLWPLALEYASQWTVSAEYEARRLADLMNACVDRPRDEMWQLQRSISDLSRPPCGRRPARAPQALVRLLAGAVPWLPLLRHPLVAEDMYDLGVLSVGMLMTDALAERGVTHTCIHDDGGRAVEHVSVGGRDGQLGVFTDEEVVSLTPAASTSLLVEYVQYLDEGDMDVRLLTFPGDPVTSEHIATVADTVAHEFDLL